jgi:hypothetical protein
MTTAESSDVRPADPARWARYADPILSAARELSRDGEWDWGDLAEVAAEAAMAVADEERAADRAEIERWTGDDTERPDWDDKVAKAQMLEYEADRADAAEAEVERYVEWSNELALILPDDAETWPGVDPGAPQEVIIADGLRYLLAERQHYAALVADLRGLADEWKDGYPGPNASWNGTVDEWWRELHTRLDKHSSDRTL